MFIELRLFRVCKLTSQQRRLHKMIAPLTKLVCDERAVSAEKHEFHFFADAQMLPIRSLQCRAGKHSIRVRGNASFDLLTQAVEPGPSVLIGYRNTAPHFL